MPDSTIRIALDGWRAGLLAILSMPRLSGTAFLFILGYEITMDFISPAPESDVDFSFRMSLVTAAQLFLSTAIFASILIAVHRGILLSEVVDRPIWRVPPTYQRFAFWLLLFNLLWAVPAVLDLWLLPVVAHSSSGAGITFLIVLLNAAFWIVAIVVSLRLMLLLPAVALATPSAEWRNAWSDSRGHAWKFFGVSALAALPMFVAGMILFWLHGSRPPGGGWLLPDALGTLLMCYVGGAVASRLFWTYAAALDPQGHPPAISSSK